MPESPAPPIEASPAYWPRDLRIAAARYGVGRVYDACVRLCCYPPALVLDLAEALPILEALEAEDARAAGRPPPLP